MASGLCSQYVMIAMSFEQALAEQIKKGVTPQILSSSQTKMDHYDFTVRTREMATEAAKVLRSQNEEEKMISKVSIDDMSAEYSENINIHIVKALPARLDSEAKPVTKWMHFLKDEDGTMLMKRVTSYEVIDPSPDGKGKVYITVNEWKRVTDDATPFFKGVVVNETGYEYHGKIDSSKFTFETKEALRNAGYNVDDPYSQTAEERGDALKEGFASHTLKPVKVRQYFQLRANISRSRSEHAFWTAERDAVDKAAVSHTEKEVLPNDLHVKR